jgi:hypothetical protein
VLPLATVLDETQQSSRARSSLSHPWGRDTGSSGGNHRECGCPSYLRAGARAPRVCTVCGRERDDPTRRIWPLPRRGPDGPSGPAGRRRCAQVAPQSTPELIGFHRIQADRGRSAGISPEPKAAICRDRPDRCLAFESPWRYSTDLLHQRFACSMGSPRTNAWINAATLKPFADARTNLRHRGRSTESCAIPPGSVSGVGPPFDGPIPH